MTDLLALAERVEAATGPCIGLDAEIAVAVGHFSEQHYEAWLRYQECGEAVNPPFAEPCPPSRYTASIDAALTLVPEGHLWMATNTGLNDRVEDQTLATAMVARGDDPADGVPPVTAVTPALAICAASLRACHADIIGLDDGLGEMG